MAARQQHNARQQADIGRLLRSMKASSDRANELSVMREVSLIPKFDRKKESFIIFAERFRTSVMMLGEELDVRTCKRLLVGLFERPEKMLHDDLPAEIRNGDDWGAFLQALFDVFHPPAACRIARETLFEIRQSASETVDEFRSRVEDAAILAYPYGEAMNERRSATRDAFLRGLNQKIRDRVRDRDPENLTAAYNYAIRYEMNDKQNETEQEDTSVHDLVNAINHLTTRDHSLGFTRSHSRDRHSRNWERGNRDYYERSQSPPRW